MYNHILITVDFDTGHELVVQKAADIAKAFGAQSSLFHAVHHDFISPAWAPSVAGYGFQGKISEEEMRKKVEDARAALKALATDHGVPNADIEVWIATSIQAAVYEVAVKKEVDLIVIGSHIRHGLDRLLVNSHGYQLLRKAPCDVLVVDLP